MQVNGDKDISLEDIERSEQMLKNSLFTVGRAVGLTDEQLENEWEKIKLESEAADVHINDL